MSKKTTIEIDIQMLEDLSHAIKMLFDLLITKPMVESDAEKIMYISKLMDTTNKKLKKINDAI
jgi:hypothetical protein